MKTNPASPLGEPRAFRRRPRIIQPALQIKYGALIAAFGMVIALTFCSLLWVQGHEMRREALDFCGSEAVAHFAKRVSSITAYTLSATALISILLTVFGIVATHRVAGPIFVMNRYLKYLGEGQIPTTRPLRKNDELKDFYANLMVVIEMLRRQANEEAAELASAVEKLSPLAATPDSQKAIDVLRRMRGRKEKSVEAKWTASPAPAVRSEVAGVPRAPSEAVD
jgi:hypothetical protein